jgi:peptidoglycan/xylan/chitin deacetylase (PgdA/CDA1 family)
MNRPASSRQRIPVLAYHSVSDSPEAMIAPFTIGPRELARQLDLVVASGRRALTVSEYVDLLDRDPSQLRGTVVITFDDGFEDNLTVAAPLLAERQLPATVYATTGFLCGRQGASAFRTLGPMIGWQDLADLEAAGVEIGAHGHSHRALDVLTHAEAHEEIALSKQLLEDALGHPVSSFAYPHGYANRWTKDEVRRCGFHSACGVRNAFSHPEDDRWQLARLTVTATTNTAHVGSWLAGTGAPVANQRQALRTTAWREARRAGAAGARAKVHMGVRPTATW